MFKTPVNSGERWWASWVQGAVARGENRDGAAGAAGVVATTVWLTQWALLRSLVRKEEIDFAIDFAYIFRPRGFGNM
ncbi:hypothetical protein NL676_026181 [Syzygium grande]|nr:hypothetical protein NL676_026181 [Syzygium grande]